MIKVHSETYSPFSENTYLLQYNDSECIIVDPGMYTDDEKNHFRDLIARKKLKPTALWLTHAHLDHIFGVNFVKEEYGLTPWINELEKPAYELAESVAEAYGLRMSKRVAGDFTMKAGQKIEVGGNEIELLFTPGHSPGSISFYSEKDQWVIGGDVLFQSSIGRTDLPGGSYETLMDTLRTVMMALPNETIVYSGHGPSTSIGYERDFNPFLQA